MSLSCFLLSTAYSAVIFYNNEERKVGGYYTSAKPGRLNR